jgi:dTDP-4-amino-4,6-dideoxygalactose transaminase
LTDAGIDTLIHYPVPPHLSGAYSSEMPKHCCLPIAEELANTVLSLPIGPHLTFEQAGRVVAVVKDVALTCRESSHKVVENQPSALRDKLP